MSHEAAEVLSVIAQLASEESGVAAEEITANTNFETDLDIDSIGMLTIATQVEEQFGLVIEDDVIPTLSTVGEVADLVAKSEAADN